MLSRTRPGSRRRRAGSQAGFTIIEVLVSALLVILIASATAKALIATSGFSGDQRLSSQADALATQDQERLRGFSDQQLNQLDSQSTSRTETERTTTFTVTSSASYLSTTGNTGCTSSAAAYYRITSTVSWAQSTGGSPGSITEQSILSRPVAGDLVVQTTDQTGSPLSGVAVQASGPSVQSDTTDSNGCVLFAGLNPGAYTVKLTDAGYVDINANPSPLSESATVTATSPATVAVRMGLAGSMLTSLTAKTTAGASAPAEADGVSWLGTGGSSGGMTAPATLPSSAAVVTGLTTTSLFPFDVATIPASYTNNYTAWGGRCPGQEPPAPTDEFSVGPGVLNLSAPVQEPLVSVGNLSYKASSGGSATAVKPADVKFSYSSGGCTDSWTAALSTAGTIPSTGWLAYPGQPYAASGLTVCADYKNSSGFYTNTGYIAFNNTSFSANNTPAFATITKGTTSTQC